MAEQMKGQGQTHTFSLCVVHYENETNEEVLRRGCHMDLDIEGAQKQLPVCLSTGASTNIITLDDFRALFPQYIGINGMPIPEVLEPDASILDARGHRLDHLGTIKLVVSNGRRASIEFFVVKNAIFSVLGFPSINILFSHFWTGDRS